MSGISPERRKLLSYLTIASHAPTALLNGFIIVHLSAPLMASLGGSVLSTKVMLLGREYYQGSYSEALLVFAPVALHVSASLLKRILSPIPPRPIKSLLSVSAIATMLLLPQHVLTHRFDPMDPTPPIFSLGPAQLDFSFVQHALQKFPIRSAVLYLALLGAVMTHALQGGALLWDTYFFKAGAQSDRKKRKQRQQLMTAAALGAAATGLFVLWSEPLPMPLPSLLNRMDAVMQKSVFYRL